MLKQTKEILTAALYTAPRCKVVKVGLVSTILAGSVDGETIDKWEQDDDPLNA